MAYSKEAIAAANKRASARLARTPTATAARYDRRRGRVVIDLSNGLSIAFRPQQTQGLEHATPDQLRTIDISPSGLGLHFPALDADLYLPGLLQGFLGSRRWMAAQLGKAGGRAKSAAKTAAARANGKLGGRPKKAHVEGTSKNPLIFHVVLFHDSPGKPIGTRRIPITTCLTPRMSGSTFLLSAHFSAKSTSSHSDLRRTCDVIALCRYDVSRCDNNFLVPEIDVRI